MSIYKGVTTNGSLLVTGNPLTYAGTLAVTNLGADALAANDSFTLFSAPSYAGSFTSLNLPVLPSGLFWNIGNLSTNGTISVTTNNLSVWNGGGGDGNWTRRRIGAGPRRPTGGR